MFYPKLVWFFIKTDILCSIENNLARNHEFPIDNRNVFRVRRVIICNIKAPLDIALALSLCHSLCFDSALILICDLFYLGLRWAYPDGKSVCNYCDHWLWDRYWYPIYFKLSGYYDFCIRMFVQHDNLPDKRSSKLIPVDFWLFLSSQVYWYYKPMIPIQSIIAQLEHSLHFPQQLHVHVYELENIVHVFSYSCYCSHLDFSNKKIWRHQNNRLQLPFPAVNMEKHPETR